jgi:hypothetical protein
MSIPLGAPSSALNDEEKALLDLHPEECFRHVVQRGAISLNMVTEGLDPRVAAAVRSTVTGERISATPTEKTSAQAPAATEREISLAQSCLTPYPRFLGLLEEQTLSWAEALAAANAIDRALGRYMTGTKYAAP